MTTFPESLGPRFLVSAFPRETGQVASSRHLESRNDAQGSREGPGQRLAMNLRTKYGALFCSGKSPMQGKPYRHKVTIVQNWKQFSNRNIILNMIFFQFN